MKWLLLVVWLLPTASWAQYNVHVRPIHVQLAKPANLYLFLADTTTQTPALCLEPGDSLTLIGSTDGWVVIERTENLKLNKYYVPQAACLGAREYKYPAPISRSKRRSKRTQSN